MTNFRGDLSDISAKLAKHSFALLINASFWRGVKPCISEIYLVIAQH